ncbi:MAG: NAD-dependent epimerase/dehydratase family protein, partial [Pseudomonadota bacterium]
MRLLVLGSAGMLGRKLVERCLAENVATDIRAFDVVAAGFGDARVTEQVGDVADKTTLDALVGDRPDTIVHLAAIVSGEAEADFEKGYRTNLAATQALFEAIRKQKDYCPRVVFASSIAVFGAPLPNPVPDTHHRVPRTSYGTQKAIAELLLNDYTRRGFMDGMALRLPTVCVRPG